MSHYLSICAVIKNENEYLAEWIAFHHLLGVDHIFLYDNDSTTDATDVLKPFEDRGVVTRRACPGPLAQGRAYTHCLSSERESSHWIAFIDVDEYLFSPDSTSLPEALKRYETEAGVGVNWVMFGSSGWLKKPPGLTIEAYTWRGHMDLVIPTPHLKRQDGSYRPINSVIKSIVNPRRVSRYISPHSFEYCNNGRAVSERGRPIVGTSTSTISIEHLRINHYWSRSREECTRKILRGRAASTRRRSPCECEDRDRVLNAEQDTTLVPYAASVALSMGAGIADVRDAS